MRKLKVCHIITMLELGGAQQNTLYTVGHLDRDKFVPLLFAGKGGLLDGEAGQLRGVKLRWLPSLVRPLNPLADLAAFLHLLWLLVWERPDIVHTHSSKAGIVGRWAAFFARVPVIIHTFHGFGFNDFQNPALRMLFALSERLSAKITDKLIAVTTEDIAKGLNNKVGFPAQYSVIRSGIDISLYRGLTLNKDEKRKELGIGTGDKVVTTIGPFKPQKNLPDFFRAAKDVAAACPESTFLVVGDGEQRPALEALIRELGMEGRIRLLGWRRDINHILAVSNLFVLTSLWEGLPRSILEAMCSGLPVVANAVDGVREIVRNGETGYTVEPGDTRAMAELITRLLKDPRRAEAMGRQAEASVDRQYDIRTMVLQQEKLYLSLYP
ncbi:MAG: glycosyltransferase family 4 protein [Endomicrobiales bacterium]